MSFMRTFSLIGLTAFVAACGKAPEQPAADSHAAHTHTASSGNVHHFTVGDLNAFALKDATFVFPNDTKIVGVGRSAEEVAALLEAAGLPTAEITLSVQPLLVQAAGKVVLFDTGTGAGGGESGGKLLASMTEAGVDPASVTDVLISHLHFDHVGGLVDGDGALTFANAAVRMSEPEWAALQANAAENENLTKLVQTIAPKVETFAEGAEVIPGLVKAVDINGHTPGHSGYLITSGAESLLYIGDTAHHSIVSVQQPDWTIQFDGDAPTAQASRKALIEDSAASGQRIYAVHFPFPGLGKFTQDGERYVWTPEQ
jgi:glyoxylase-like metal-dependent hydrolase (beta-lactamase superfamily II)